MHQDHQDLIHKIFNYQRSRNSHINKALVHQFIDDLFMVLFENKWESKREIGNKLQRLQLELSIIINDVEDCASTCNEKSMAFFRALNDLYDLLIQDAEFILDNDPAATTIDEILNSYLGFYAIAVYRFAHSLLHLNIPLIPRLFSEYAHSKTGVDIHPGASIGKQFFIDHGTGIVIGETANIGNRVKIYQGVTLGALSVSKDKASTKRHPSIEDDVVIYSGATILGGNTTIGARSIIGGNVWLTSSVEPASKIFHKGQIIRKEQLSS